MDQLHEEEEIKLNQNNNEEQIKKKSLKRNREIDENEDDNKKNLKNIRKKIEKQRNNIEEENKGNSNFARELCEIYNNLQGISKDINIDFETPEIVVVGMQSDGKSSFIEGLLGFQFNIVETNIGTRRPLILQMINNPLYNEPYCIFRKENPTIEENPFEDENTGINDLTKKIIERTNQIAGESLDCVSCIPIILKIEYKYCSNLTIYDTPGFRLGGNEKLRNQIIDMTINLIKPKHRIIVCLEQSTVEWSNSTSRPIVKAIDPQFSRTILVNTKFDNRVKEFRTSDSINNYFKGEDLPEGIKPFFISMPLRRGLNINRYQENMKECFLEDYEKLIEIGFNEKENLSQLGIFKVSNYLQKVLQNQYIKNLNPTLKILNDLCQKSEIELKIINDQLNQYDLSKMKEKSFLFIKHYINNFEKLLCGSIAGDPEKNGETLEEEKLNSNVNQWSDSIIHFSIQNENLKIYGSSQYFRLLNEFQYIVHSQEFPNLTHNEIASVIGITKDIFATPSYQTAATNLIQHKSKQVLLPLINILLKRASYIMKRLFYIIIQTIKYNNNDDKTSSNNSISFMTIYEKFMKEIKNNYITLIENIEKICEIKLREEFFKLSKIINWDLINGNNLFNKIDNFEKQSNEKEIIEKQSNEKEFISSTEQKNQFIKKRVESIMQSNNLFEVEKLPLELDNKTYEKVYLLSKKIFSGLRYNFANHICISMNVFFLEQM